MEPRMYNKFCEFCVSQRASYNWKAFLIKIHYMVMYSSYIERNLKRLMPYTKANSKRTNN